MRFCRDSCEEVPCFTPGGGGAQYQVASKEV